MMKTARKISRALLFFLLLTGLFSETFPPDPLGSSVRAAPMRQAATGVVISEFRFRGDGMGNDEFVELYNPTASPVDISGWLIRGSNNAGATSTRATIPALTILQPGQYYLVAHTGYSGPAAADLTYGTGITDDGGVALTLADGVTVVDQAGLSAGSAYKEGTPLPALTTNEDRGYERRASGCFDSGDNSADFSLMNPSVPNNSFSPFAPCADFSLTVSANTTTPAIGSNVTFTITVFNDGPNNATGVTVRNVLPSGLTYLSDDSGGNYNSGTGDWAVGNLASGSSAVLNLTATVATGGMKVNAAEVWDADQVDPDSIAGNSSTTEDDDDSVTLTVPTVALTIANTVNNPNPPVGANVVFTITVSNPAGNPSPASGVSVNALLPAGLNYVSHSAASGTTYSGASGIWSVGSLPLGSTVALSVTARVVTTNPPPYAATVSSNEFLPATATAVINNPLSGEADLRLAHDPLAPFTVSASAAGQVRLNLVLQNLGPDRAANVQVRDLLPDGLDYVSHTASLGTYNSGAGIWFISELPAGANPTLGITVQVASSGTSTKNTAEVWRSDQYDPTSTPADGSGDDYTALEVPIADLSLSQTVSVAGGNAVFRITIRNDGPDNASGVAVRSPFTGYTLISDDGGGSFSAGVWNVGTLTKNTSRTLTVTTAYSGSLPINWAQISAVNEVDPDSRPNNCSNTLSTCSEDDDAAAPAADLSLTHSVNYDNVDVGADVVFTIRVTNNGPANTGGVQVKCVLPGGLTYLNNDQGTAYNKSTGIWTVGALNGGASATLNITARVAVNGIHTNYAEVWKSDQDDPDSKPANNSTAEDDNASAVVVSYRSVIINEIAWGGTAAGAGDEWMELYNPSGATVNLNGWTLKSTSGSLNLTLSGSIKSGSYFLLERGDNFTVSDVAADQIYQAAGAVSNLLSDSGETLILRDAAGRFIDAANGDGGEWAQGSAAASLNYASMERQGFTAETDKVWVTNRGTPRNGLDSNGGPIYGTPKKANSTGNTPTPTPVSPSASATAVGRPVINEYLPRPGFDWNQDGKVDVFDEFIEVKNIGAADINLKGWQLDDEAGKGSLPFLLPDLVLKPGQHAIFYGLQTSLLLGDGGDTVRLLNPAGKIYDAHTYALAGVEDRSVCRLPDGTGVWYEDCVPTPNRLNSREGEVPTMPEGGAFQSPVCNLPDTLPADFLFAECRGYGADIWRSYFWDRWGWMGERPVPENTNKRQSFVE